MTDQTLRLRDSRSLPIFWIHKALIRTYQLSWKAIITYTALAYFADSSTGTLKHVGLKQLAAVVGVSDDTISRGLAELESKKVIRVRARYSKKKNGKPIKLPNEYTMLDLKDEIPI